jgi:hypothetical protein
MTTRPIVDSLLANRARIKQYGAGAFLLLGANLISGVSLALISSGRLSFIGTEVANFIVIFIQWQVFALTGAKFGIDQVVFAAVSADNTITFDASRHIVRRVIPITVLFAVIIGMVYSPWASLGLLVSLPLDTYSVMRIADLNARKKFPLAAAASLFNYPVFVVLLVVIGLTVELSAVWVVVVFCFSSFTRALYLWGMLRLSKSRGSALKQVDSQVSMPMVMQQAMNYWLFRSDVLLLSFAGPAGIPALDIQRYLFLSRFCDFVAVLINSLGPVVYPLAFIRYPFGQDGARSRRQQAVRLGAAFAGMFVILSPLLFLYQMLWSSNDITPIQALPFLIEAALILLPNLITYSMLRQSYLPSLLRNLIASLGVGFTSLIGIIVLSTGNLHLLPLMIVIQLGAFTILGIAASWGKTKALVSF